MYTLVIICILLVAYITLLCVRKSKNEARHKDAETLYAHYSRIDTFNYVLFPSLMFTNPMRLTLHAGESLFIPKNWWHWVKTTEKTFAINYWFINKEHTKPFVFKFDPDVDIPSLKDIEVSYWRSTDNKQLEHNLTFENFYSSALDNLYIITLDTYYTGFKNLQLKEAVKGRLKIPEVVPETYDYNVWVSAGKHDTGLHYDDEDGVLSVVEGTKDIILFPPSDTQYLRPYEVVYPWISEQAFDFHYNIGLVLKKIKGPSSSQLLYETCKHDKRVLANITRLYKAHHNQHLTWGFKKQGDAVRWEIYKYTIHSSPMVTSWDVYGNTYKLDNKIHYYYKDDDGSVISELPVWGYGKYEEDGKFFDESKRFVICTYHLFEYKYDEYMAKLGYKSIADEFKPFVFRYDCYELCLHNKDPGLIFIQSLGISNKDFITFLKENEYPQNIIDFANQPDYAINNEITIVYDIKTKQVVRTAIYGGV